MSHDQHIGTGKQKRYGRDGFHKNSAFFRITQYGRFISGLLGFLALPDFVAQVVDDRKLQLVVALSQSRHAEAFHNGIRIFQAVAQTACGGVDDDFIHRQSQVFKQNIDLLGKVNVNGRVGYNAMAVPHGSRADTLVVFVFHRSEDQLLTHGFFGNLL